MSCACVLVTDNTVPLESLLRHIAPTISEVPYEVMLDMLRQAYTEFARKTKLLASHQELRIQKGVRNYKLEPPEGYEVYALLQADICDGVSWSYTSFPNANYWYYFWGDRLHMDGNEQIVFQREPTQDNIQRILALHLLPNDCCTTIPREIATPFGKQIAWGALADILDMPGKAWYNPRAASNKRIEFNRGVQSGIAKFLTNNGAHPVVMKPIRIL